MPAIMPTRTTAAIRQYSMRMRASTTASPQTEFLETVTRTSQLDLSRSSNWLRKNHTPRQIRRSTAGAAAPINSRLAGHICLGLCRAALRGGRRDGSRVTTARHRLYSAGRTHRFAERSGFRESAPQIESKQCFRAHANESRRPYTCRSFGTRTDDKCPDIRTRECDATDAGISGSNGICLQRSTMRTDIWSGRAS
jgi:hypothetical protein